uniref:Ryanodine receptor Ryr domain-containing protein n=1 Tax=Palpitomonas bilix TaxID=652834 RepID=A0A7S3GFB5_9EUKA|mmetsp:Transcript_46916/g.121006  ORF Transcript_46916/g.121006 Transcript_46916/m.121006 type:complete len:510 (+) Transcript_46916:1913-3442(+)
MLDDTLVPFDLLDDLQRAEAVKWVEDSLKILSFCFGCTFDHAPMVLKKETTEGEKREVREGIYHVPRPLQSPYETSVSSEQDSLVNLLAETEHEVWVVKSAKEGWKWGRQRNNSQRLHPNMVPFSHLPENRQETYMSMCRESIQALNALGLSTRSANQVGERVSGVEIEFENDDGTRRTYRPTPVVPHQLQWNAYKAHLHADSKGGSSRMWKTQIGGQPGGGIDRVKIISQLAVNAHEEFCFSRIGHGWSYGQVRKDTNKICVGCDLHMFQVFDEGRKHHPSMVAFEDLPESERAFYLRKAATLVGTITALGFDFYVSDKGLLAAEDGEKVKVPTIHPRSAVVSSAKALRPLRLPLFLSQLIDLMAENGHHGWCAKMINKGWRHGRFVNKAKNLLPTICPFEKLPDTDKEKLRRPMRGILSQIVRCGYVIEPNPVFEGRSGSSSLLIHAPKKSKPQPEIMQVDGTMFAPKTINPSMCEAVDAGIDGPLKSLIMELAEFAEKNRQKRRDN